MLVAFYSNFPDLLNWIHFFVGQQKIKVENNSLLYLTLRRSIRHQQRFTSYTSQEKARLMKFSYDLSVVPDVRLL